MNSSLAGLIVMLELFGAIPTAVFFIVFLNDEPFNISYVLRALVLSGLAFLVSAVSVWYTYTLPLRRRHKEEP
jgi:hypothetical protein